MTGENKTVEPNKDGLSGSLSGNKKNHSAQKKSEPAETILAEDVNKGRPPKFVSILTERAKNHSKSRRGK